MDMDMDMDNLRGRGHWHGHDFDIYVETFREMDKDMAIFIGTDNLQITSATTKPQTRYFQSRSKTAL